MYVAESFTEALGLHQEIHTREKPYKRNMGVTGSFLRRQPFFTSFTIHKFIWQKSLPNAVSVARSLIIRETLQFTREFILEKNFTNVLSYTKSFMSCQPLQSIN